MKNFLNTVLFVQTHINISRKDIEVIFHGHRSLLFHDNEPCTKKESNGDFDVTMGSYEGAEVYHQNDKVWKEMIDLFK